MLLFYCPQISNDNNILPKAESAHCIRVLRKCKGDTINITDGFGNLYTAVITDPSQTECEFRVTKVIAGYGKRSFRVHIAISPTKNTRRFEWFLEKATEIGVDEITPIISHNSERRTLNPDRLKKVLAVAMKQSLKTNMPLLHPLVDLNEFFDNINKGSSGGNENLFIAKYDPLHPSLSNKVIMGQNAVVLIGPEGDFDEQEVETAKEAGFEMVNLSNSRLRTETAGLVACTTIGMANEAQ